MPKREDVLRWFAGLEQVLRENGVDMHNPGDLMRVRAYYFRETEDTKMPGNPENFKGERVYAFMPRRINPATGQMTDLENKPELPNERTQQRLSELHETLSDAAKEYGYAFNDLVEAYESDRGEDEIRELKQRIVQKNNRKEELFDELIRDSNETLAAYNQWVLGNQKVFDPEEDYDQIEELYKLASQGFLYINPLEGETIDRWQILVSNDNEPCVTKIASGNAKTERVEDLYTAIFPSRIDKPEQIQRKAEYKAQLEARFGEIHMPKEVETPKPNEPEEVPAPGAWSWFKRIITFNIVKTDFTNYETYQQDMQQYRRDKAVYDEDVLRTREYNKACHNKAVEILNEKYIDKLPEGVKDPARIVDNSMLMHTSEFTIQEADNENGIYNEEFPLVMKWNELHMAHEAHENPASFDQNWSRNDEASRNYWNEKREIKGPGVQKDENKAFDRLKEAEKDWNVRKAIGSEKQKEVRTSWGREAFDTTMKNIGALFGKDTAFGFKAFSACICQIQEYDADNMKREAFKLEPEDVMKELNTLIGMANDPEKKKTNPELLEKLDLIIQNEAMDPTRIVDSASAIVLNGRNEVEPNAYSLNKAQAFCAIMAKRVAKTSPNFNPDYPVNYVDDEPVSLCDAQDRKHAIKLGGKCEKIFEKRYVEPKQVQQVQEIQKDVQAEANLIN